MTADTARPAGEPTNYTDEERRRLATLTKARRWHGPVETIVCLRHPDHVEQYRWTWSEGATPESDGTPQTVAECPKCVEEYDGDDE